MGTVAKIEEFKSNFISRQDYNIMDIIQFSSEESNVKSKLQTSTLHTELDIKNEIDTFQNRIEHEHASIEKHSRGFPILYKTLTEKSGYMDHMKISKQSDLKNDTDTSALHTELDIKDESDISAPILLDSDSEIRHDQATHGKADGIVFICYNCEYTIHRKHLLINHIKVHTNRRNMYSCDYCRFQTYLKRSLTAHMRSHPFNKCHTCLYCSATFKRKWSLDKHILNKHPTSLSSATRKIHKCLKCPYKTTLSCNLKQHLMKHTVKAVETEVRTTKSADMEKSLKHSRTTANYQFHACTGCSAVFFRKSSLDNHIIKKHPSLISSVTRKIHECKYCTYRTTSARERKRHLLKHPETAADYEYFACIHCNAKYLEKRSLGNHIINKHPSFVSSITSKIYECAKCSFKTTYSLRYKEHLSNHLETAVYTCIHCNVTFKSKHGLDHHIVSKHPDFLSSVTHKIHECTKCSFKTTSTSQLKAHSLKHPETAANFKYITCIHCKASFRRKLNLDEHIIRKHPNFISSVTRKLRECTMCSFKSISTIDWNRHLLKHPETAARYKFNTCVHCKASFKKKVTLDEHTIKKHPNFISSVTNKVYECTKCTFKTVRAMSFNKHLLKHSETAALCKLNTCIHCSKVFNDKTLLNEHIIRKHPDFIASVTSKIHECKECSFKTTNANVFKKHLLKHPETAALYMLSTCGHCKASFRSKMALDDHTIKKHPSFISSVTHQIHECTKCTFKTTISTHLKTHVLTHTKTKEVITKTSVRC